MMTARTELPRKKGSTHYYTTLLTTRNKNYPLLVLNPDTKTSAQKLITNLVHGIDRLTLQYSAVTYWNESGYFLFPLSSFLFLVRGSILVGDGEVFFELPFEEMGRAWCGGERGLNCWGW